jgi:cytidylate kinase
MKIAISGLTGCGNSTASTLVSHSLKLKKFNYTFHNLAEELGMPFERLHEFAEKNPKYDYLLDRKQIEFALAEKNCVVGTRLAVFLDRIAPRLKKKRPKFDLKVWLKAPLHARAKRLAERDIRDFDQAVREVVYRDDSNKTRYWKLYKIRYEPPKGCLIIDNERLDVLQTARLIVEAAKKIKAGKKKARPKGRKGGKTKKRRAKR